MDANEFNVEITSEGRDGNIIYNEDGGNLTFWWEFSTNGAIINLPANENWNGYCQNNSSNWTKDRKAEVVERIAAEVCRQKAFTAKF